MGDDIIEMAVPPETTVETPAETTAPETPAVPKYVKRYRGKKLTAIVVDETTWPKFLQICKLQDVSASAVIRRFVAEYVQQHEHLLSHE